MDAHTLVQHRPHNQRSTQHSFHTPAEVVRWLGAIQGQDYPGAKWAIGLHLVAAEDIRWLLALVARRYGEYLELPAAVV